MFVLGGNMKGDKAGNKIILQTIYICIGYSTKGPVSIINVLAREVDVSLVPRILEMMEEEYKKNWPVTAWSSVELQWSIFDRKKIKAKGVVCFK
jgi:hypothetical protein